MGLVIIILLMVVGILFLIIFNVRAVKNKDKDKKRVTSAENPTLQSKPDPVSAEEPDSAAAMDQSKPKVETKTKVAPRTTSAKQEISRQTDQEYREALRRGLSAMTKPEKPAKKDHIDDDEYRKMLRQMQQKK
jgi:FtsZ-interacting cell division protein ZipA